jgi:flagellar biosynthesis protein FlhB
MPTLFRFIFRLLLVVFGLVFAVSLLVFVVLGFALWSLRALWFKLTGQAVKPFVMRMNPCAGFGRVYRAANPQSRSAHMGEVVDAEVKVIKNSL